MPADLDLEGFIPAGGDLDGFIPAGSSAFIKIEKRKQLCKLFK